jgi:N-acylglucosamine-6-phosphate 2-epimerase
MKIDEKLAAVQHGLIVSCHIDEEEQETMPDLLSYFARTAERGGAAGLRIEGVDGIRRLRPRTALPIVGFTQGSYDDGSPLITPSIDDAERLIAAGADFVAVDATRRKRPDGSDGFLFFEELRKRFTTLLWADVATFREGVHAAECGADVIATTLAGYTAGTVVKDYQTPDFTLIHELSNALTIPVIAEGRIWTPDSAARAVELGAYAVVVGSAITRPHVVTQMFVNAVRTSPHNRH